MEDANSQTDPDDGTGTPPMTGNGPSLGPGAVEFLTLGLTLAVTVLVAGALGYLVDRWLGTSPVFTLVGLVLGLAAAVMTAVSRVRKYL
ncbi:MAG: AtpZ/AtpI family protein [Acidimicrobiales bacterium]|jgi:ATP synthase protein I